MIKRLIFFVAMNIFELCILLLSLMTYTTPFKASPWYEPDSLALLGIFIVSPGYLLVGITLLLLGKYMPISKMNKVIPFAAFITLIIPIIIINDYPLHFYNWMYFGISACCVLILGVIITTIKDSILVRKNIKAKE